MQLFVYEVLIFDDFINWLKFFLYPVGTCLKKIILNFVIFAAKKR